MPKFLFCVSCGRSVNCHPPPRATSGNLFAGGKVGILLLDVCFTIPFQPFLGFCISFYKNNLKFCQLSNPGDLTFYFL